MTRSEENKLAFNSIYAILARQMMQEDYDPAEVIAGVCNCDFDDVPLFVKRIVVKAIANQVEIENLIKQNLKNWEYDRVTLIRKACILFAFSDCKYCQEVDKITAINIVINFAKEYGDVNDYKFINAILDKTL